MIRSQKASLAFITFCLVLAWMPGEKCHTEKASWLFSSLLIFFSKAYLILNIHIYCENEGIVGDMMATIIQTLVPSLHCKECLIFWSKYPSLIGLKNQRTLSGATPVTDKVLEWKETTESYWNYPSLTSGPSL